METSENAMQFSKAAQGGMHNCIIRLRLVQALFGKKLY